MRKDKESHGKFNKRLLYDKRPVENLTSSLLVFSLFQDPRNFCKKIDKQKIHFVRRILKVFVKFYYPINWYDLATLYSKMTAL